MTGYIHNDGVAWDQAPLPPVRHRCNPQSWAKVEEEGGLAFMCRCRCGAAGLKRFAQNPVWKGKNSRRKDPLTIHSTYRRPWWLALLKRAGL